MAGKKDNKNKDKLPVPAEGADGGDGGESVKKKLSGKTLVLFIILPALLVIGGGGAAAFMMFGAGAPAQGEKAGKTDDAEHAAAEKPAAAPGEEGENEGVGLTVGESGMPSYYDLPKMIVNLSGEQGGRPLLLQLELVLEAQDPAVFNDIPAVMPRLQDQFQTFLRELRVEDLNGSSGTHQLRLELLRRTNLVIAPAKVDAVLIEAILVQ
jgi:flagellar FliL protein